MNKFTVTRETLSYFVSLYDEEINSINKFLEKHTHEQPNNIAPDKYVISFHRNSVCVIPTIKCWCGVEENIACDERYDNI